MSANYYRKADGVFVVYSVANRKSFENVRYWMDEVEKHAPEHATIILVGNKNDLDNRAVTSQEGKVKRKFNVQYSLRRIRCTTKYRNWLRHWISCSWKPLPNNTPVFKTRSVRWPVDAL